MARGTDPTHAIARKASETLRAWGGPAPGPAGPQSDPQGSGHPDRRAPPIYRTVRVQPLPQPPRCTLGTGPTCPARPAQVTSVMVRTPCSEMNWQWHVIVAKLEAKWSRNALKWSRNTSKRSEISAKHTRNCAKWYVRSVWRSFPPWPARRQSK